jgi:translation elongation factor aEF-1 beta
MESIKEQISKLEAKEIKEEEIAFGLKSLKVLFLMEDKGGVQEEIIKNLGSIDGVKEVQILDTTLI